MIIRRIHAENILRYKLLEMSDLPSHGRIFIAGPNESGKSAILETMCLAIFGRTSNLTNAMAGKAVRWGADSASVSLDFIGPDQNEYSIFRYFDADGVQRARLNGQDQETPLAQGVEEVNQAVVKVIGFDFQQFTSALYLTHGRHSHARPGETVKELAGVTALETLSGNLATEINATEAMIAARSRRQVEFTEQINILNIQEELLGKLENQRDHARQQVAMTASTIERWEGFDAGLVHAAKSIESAIQRLKKTSQEIGLASWLSRSNQLDAALKEVESICLGGYVEMETTPADSLRQWHSQLQGRLTALQNILEGVNDEQNRLLAWLGQPTNQPTPPAEESYATEAGRLEHTLTQSIRRRRRQGWAMRTFLFLAFVLWAVTGVVWQHQQNPTFLPVVTDLLAQHLPMWHLSQFMVILPAASFCTLIVFWNFIGRWRMQRKIGVTKASQKQLAQQADYAQSMVAAIYNAANQSLAHQVEILNAMEATPWGADLSSWVNEEGRPFLDEESLHHYLAGLDTQLSHFQSENTLYRDEAKVQRLAAVEENRVHQENVAALVKEVESEKARRQENVRLHAAIEIIVADNARDRRDMEMRRIARELLKGTCVELSSRFNQELHLFISRTAPLFTQGRYQHLRMDSDLNVEVFSVAKNDFVQVEELSTGVRRQLTLALRMSLAQALASRTGGAHFIALDEPFAYFDHQRCRESLDALSRISDKISQLFVIAQEFHNEIITSKLYIQCTGEQDRLILTAGH
ncbi:MAG: AAA family ATPase [Magnetococcales bacterium]|nr:AAA family ATPase [Magnetococcales bacterium]MBF0439082.1 AAA family ATPase [Magnetococcales bacterium]